MEGHINNLSNTYYRMARFLGKSILLFPLLFTIIACSENTDPGITVDPVSGLTTTEGGQTASFSIVLNSEPDTNVRIQLQSSNVNEGIVSHDFVMFNSANWNTPKKIEIIGVDDDIQEEDISYAVEILPAESMDDRYSGLDAPDVSITNQDNDGDSKPLPPPVPTAGITIEPNENLITGEGLNTASFSVVLNSEPMSDVEVFIVSNDTSEVTVSSQSILFNNVNWNFPQIITLTGIDDELVDGDVTYSISISVQSTDEQYNNLAVPEVTGINRDNDEPPPPPPPSPASVVINPLTGLITNEDQTSVALSVTLASQPSADVRLSLSSSDVTEGTVSPEMLTFNTTDWSVVQTVTVFGVEDSIVDGEISYSIVINIQSDDPNYNGLVVPPVTVVNQDNEIAPPLPVAGITVSPASGLTTSEDLTSDSFTVVLDSEPSAEVSVSATSSDTTEGNVSQVSAVFTASNWNLPQEFTVVGADDSEVDGDISYAIDISVVSDDIDYSGLLVPSVTAVNQDNDVTPPPPPAGIAVSPTAGLVTSEDSGFDTFTVVLESEPSSDVTVSAASDNSAEGNVSPASVVFNAGNWSEPQEFTVTGVNDDIVDGDIAYGIALAVQSNDTDYSGMVLPEVSVLNQDNDIVAPQPGMTVSPTSGLITNEDLASDTFTLVLDSQPTANVNVSIFSSNTTEGTVSPVALTFNSSNWSAAQIVTVTGVDDSIVDGQIAYAIDISVQSSDPLYDGLLVPSVAGTNQDNDVPPPAGITINPTSGLITSEDLNTDSFTVVLESQPTANVTISITSSDVSEGTVLPLALTFTSANWDVTQTVNVTGVDDAEVDGDINYSIGFDVQSSDSNYSGMIVPPVAVTNRDNDVAPPPPPPGITVNPLSGLVTTEDLGTDFFTMVLQSQPASNVSITLSSSDTNEGSISPTILSFTIANWNVNQTVTVTGVDDVEVDGDVPYTITSSVQSSDTAYNGMILPSVSVVNQDNDVAPPPPPPPVSYTIFIEPGSIDITASEISGNGAASIPIWGYALSNTLPGKSPGPVIEAVVGQQVTVEVINDHNATHRFEIERLLTNTAELLPGETRQFQFTPTEAGVFRYGDPEIVSRSLGLQGAVVVRPVDGSNTAWAGGPSYSQERIWVVTDMDETWNRNASSVDTTQYDPNYFFLNGKNGFAAKSDPASSLNGTVGETFLVRIVNAGQYDQSLHFHGNHFQIISEGGFKTMDINNAIEATTINVKRGSTAMLLYNIDQAGTFPVHVHSAQMETGNGVYLNGVATFIIGQ